MWCGWCLPWAGLCLWGLMWGQSSSGVSPVVPRGYSGSHSPRTYLRYHCPYFFLLSDTLMSVPCKDLTHLRLADAQALV